MQLVGKEKGQSSRFKYCDKTMKHCQYYMYIVQTAEILTKTEAGTQNSFHRYHTIQ
jgi:hypothetical protein